ncbi:preprotein translocase subunit SecG [SAR202 cluster bacterium AC-647-N09_OGT_505m]|nr:preprotein translocase subunit SecG [SAR202 cluster bacterium AC-647-N09_OGT_505m]
MDSFFQTAQILVSILLIAIILIQIRGQGSGFFGSAQASFRTRRGVEKTLFQFTVVLAVVFTLLAIVSAIRPALLF